jgi:hypothetical protein
MKTTLKYFTVMATLALISTISNQAHAQKNATASMTIRATVIESGAVESLSSILFADAASNESGYTAISMQPAGFSVSGITNSEIGINISRQESETQEAHSVFFAPNVKVEGFSTGFSNELKGNVMINGLGAQLRGKTSVWIEGVLQSQEDMAKVKYQGEYLVSVEYN